MATTADEQATLAAERAAGLRALADLIEEHPDLAGSKYSWIFHEVQAADAVEMAKLIRQAGGKRTKHELGKKLIVRREFGAGICLDIEVVRDEVCEAVVVGTKTVEVPDPEAPMVTVERDVIEWRCAPILTEALAGDPSAPGLAETVG